MDSLVIGSGPIGMIASLKLLRSGFNVTMLDIGALPSKDDAVLKKMLKEQFDQMSARQNLWKKKLGLKLVKQKPFLGVILSTASISNFTK